MKRVLSSACLAMIVASSMAQGAFTIRTPANGAVVREKFAVRIPKSSIPATGYVGIWLNDKFVEAVAPIDGLNTSGSDFVYTIDSKAAKLNDGPLKIEAVLYVDNGRSTEPINKTSITVTLDNTSSIRVPQNGLVLRYKFKPGTEYNYTLEVNTLQQTLTRTQQQMGRAAELGSSSEKLRYRYAILNTDVVNGQKAAVVLMQPLPPKGKEYAWLTIAGDTERKKYFTNQMMPVYMKISDTGREFWGSIPNYFGFEGAYQPLSDLFLYAILPLPILPARGVKPNAPFAGVLQEGKWDKENADTLQKLVTGHAGSGKLVAVEFERGLRCARIQSKINANAADAELQDIEDNYWFAMDLGMVIKMERKITQTVKVDGETAGGGGNGGGPNGPPSNSKRLSAGGGRWINSIFGGDFMKDHTAQIDSSGTFLQLKGASNSANPAGGNGRDNRGNLGGGGNNGGMRTGTRFVKVTTTLTMTLE